MLSRTTRAIAAPALLVSAAAFTTTATAGEGDFGLLNINGVLTTAIADDENGTFEDIGARVLETEFEEIIPGTVAIDDPGFFFTDGEFAAGAEITFNHRGPIRLWNGSDFSNLASSVGSDIGFTDGSNTEFAPTSGVAPSSFIFEYGGTGDFDEHPDYVLTGTQATGVYLWELELIVNNDPSLTVNNTGPLFILFGFGASEDTIELAEDYVNNVLVPAPGAIALLAGTGMIATRRRR